MLGQALAEQTLLNVMTEQEHSSHAAQIPALVPRGSTAPPPRD